MAPPQVPCTPPTELVAGASAVWDDASVSHPQYGTFTPADGWTLTYNFVGPAGAVEVESDLEGSGWRTNITSAQTTSLQDPDTLGDQSVSWTRWVTQGTDRFPVGQGVLPISPDPAQQNDGFVSEARTELAAAKAARSRGLTAYTMHNRSFQYDSAEQRDKRIARLEFQIWQEDHPGQFGIPIAGVFQ